MTDMLADDAVGSHDRDPTSGGDHGSGAVDPRPLRPDGAAGGDIHRGDEAYRLVDLLHRLEETEVGIDFIYGALDRLAEEYALRDAVVVLEDEQLGAQAFRLGRAPWGSDLSTEILRFGSGLYSVPEVVPPAVRMAVTGLCQIALSLDLARHGSHHDPVSGLANARAFRLALEAAAARSARYSWRFTIVLLGPRITAPDGGPAPGTDRSIAYLSPTGDMAELGDALRHALRSGDIGAQLAGDTFAVMLHGVDAGGVGAFVDRLTNALPVGQPAVDLAIGAATAPDESIDPTELWRLAQSRFTPVAGDDEGGATAR